MSLFIETDVIERVVRDAPAFLRMHLEGTGAIAREWAEYQRLLPEEIAMFAVAGFAHDIGKLVIPIDVLLKPASLSAHETVLVRRHVACGIGILNGLADLEPRVLTIIGQHHERMDGNGYPHGLTGDLIDPLARRLSIVDAFAAMTEERAYQETRSELSAIKELSRSAGAQFDSRFVDEFVEWRGHR